MFGAVDDDDLDFNPAAGSKLASLFNLEGSTGKGNATLTYTAPKQPKSRNSSDNGVSSSKQTATVTNTTGSTKNKLTLIIAKAVTSYKLEDGNYNHLGKLGLALLGNSTSGIFQILLYKGKQQQITTARISPNFQFTVQPHLYATFYDDRMQNWSIMFENKEDSIEFTTQVAVARYRVAVFAEESVIFQELLPGSGTIFQEGDTVQLQLAALPFTVDSVQAVDIKKSMVKCSLPHKLEKSGWAAGLLGSASGAVRLILVPVTTHVPWISSKRNEPFLIEVNISGMKEMDVSKSKEPFLGEANPEIKTSDSACGIDSAVDSSTEDSSVRARGASIKEALSSSPRSVKASIISRMARMGQATLPLKGAIACNPSDSEETEEDSGKMDGIKPPLKARPGKARSGSSSVRQQVSPLANSPQSSSASSSVPTAAVTVVQAPLAWGQHQQNILQRTGGDSSLVQIVTSEGQIVSLGQQQLPLVATQSSMMSPTDPTSHISMFLSESRMQNTEMRMNLSKFSDKMDQLMDKVNNLSTLSGAPSAGVLSAGVGLEPNVLLSSIEKLVRDNQALQADIADKNKRLDEQNERIFSLLNTNSKFLEQSSNLFEQKQHQEQQQQKQEQLEQQQQQQLFVIQQLREEKASLANQLVSLQNQLATLQEFVHALQKSNGELNNELESTRNRLQEKEKSSQKIDQTKYDSGSEDELLKVHEAVNEQRALNLKLQEQIATEKAKFDSEAKESYERIRNMEKQHLVELSQAKEEVKKQLSNQYMKSVSTLEAECESLKRKLEESPKQANTSSLDHLISDVKLLMNTLYRGLTQQFVNGQNYEGGQIRAVIASLVKKEAHQFVDKMEKLQSGLEKSLDTARTTGVSSSEKAGVTSENISEGVAAVADININSTSVGNQKGVDEEKSTADLKEEDSTVGTLWKPLPPPPPLFPDEDDSDEWLT